LSANEYYVQDSAYRIDPATNRATRIVIFPERRALAGGLLLHSFAVSGGAVWVVVKQADDHGLLVWFDERTGKELGRQTIRPGPDGIAPGEGAVWIRSNGLNPAILRIDPATGKVVATIPVGGADAIAAGEGALWVADATDNAVLKIDPATNSSAGLITEGLDLPTAIGVDLGSVWVINRTSCTVARIDPGTNRVVSSVNPNVVQMGTVAAGVEGIWVGGGGFFGRAGCG
jgi:DNA-binding beta-propeller fold protein YncE